MYARDRQRQIAAVVTHTRIGSFVCVVSHYPKERTYDMKHLLWQAIGIVDSVERGVSDPLYQVRFPKYVSDITHFFYADHLRVASKAEGKAAFLLDQIREEEKAEDRMIQRRMLQAAQSAQVANLKPADF